MTIPQPTTGSTDERQFATFKVGQLLFGVDVHEVQEIIRYQQLTPVPLANEVVRGLMNLRGQIITAIDLRRRLALPSDGSAEHLMNIVVSIDSEKVSLLVDSVGDVIKVSSDLFENTPPTVVGKIRDLSRGVFKLNDGLMLVLNTERAITV
jgi:purine-binding chemotaxis protein CheW